MTNVHEREDKFLEMHGVSPHLSIVLVRSGFDAQAFFQHSIATTAHNTQLYTQVPAWTFGELLPHAGLLDSNALSAILGSDKPVDALAQIVLKELQRIAEVLRGLREDALADAKAAVAAAEGAAEEAAEKAAKAADEVMGAAEEVFGPEPKAKDSEDVEKPEQ